MFTKSAGNLSSKAAKPADHQNPKSITKIIQGRLTFDGCAVIAIWQSIAASQSIVEQ